MTLSTHVLDTSVGRPAASVAVRVQREEGGRWVDVSAHATDADGRVASLLPAGAPASAGSYRLSFDAGAYFASRGAAAFYSTIAIEFVTTDAAAHYHVPLLLSPFGYSTYRGS
jgi:5-hydroxyisourate hydrolase